MKEEQEKRPYGAPRLTVAEFRAERGFAGSTPVALGLLIGSEGVEGLETRLARASAAYAEAKALSDGLSRRLASLDSAIATAESKGQTVVDYVRFDAAETATGKVREAGKGVDGIVESTDPKAIDVAAEDESAKARRDAALESLLEGL